MFQHPVCQDGEQLWINPVTHTCLRKINHHKFRWRVPYSASIYHQNSILTFQLIFGNKHHYMWRKTSHINLQKWMWKFSLQNGDHFVLASIGECMIYFMVCREQLRHNGGHPGRIGYLEYIHYMNLRHNEGFPRSIGYLMYRHYMIHWITISAPWVSPRPQMAQPGRLMNCLPTGTSTPS